MNFDALTDFRLVVLHGSFAKASRDTGRPKATLSRHVCELEESLGTRLFERESTGLRLTAEGELLSSRALDLLAEVEGIREEITASVNRPQGKLRIGAPVLFSQAALGELAAKFLKEYPEVTLEIALVDRSVDVADEGFDLLIQVNPKPHSDLVGRCFLRDHVVIVAAPALHDQAIAHADEVFDVPAILPTGATATAMWNVEIEGVKRQARPREILRLPSRLMIRDAVYTGLGAAELPHSIVSADLIAGRLVSWGAAAHETVELWALHNSRRLVSRKVRAFTDFLCREGREYSGAHV